MHERQGLGYLTDDKSFLHTAVSEQTLFTKYISLCDNLPCQQRISNHIDHKICDDNSSRLFHNTHVSENIRMMQCSIN